MAQLYENMTPHGPLLIKASLNSAQDISQFSDKPLINDQAIKVFYSARGSEPYWLKSSSSFGKVEILVETLEGAWKHGLNPESYHLTEIKDLIAKPNVLRREEMEVLLTDAFVRYVRDLSGIRVDTARLRTSNEYWRQPLKVEEALALLSSGKSMDKVLQSVQPHGTTYARLQEELVRLVETPPEPYEHVLPITLGYRFFQPGKRDQRIPDLRTRLGVEPLTDDKLLYDDRLVAAVIKFQREKGLNDDGIIGPNTLEALNRTNEERILQIVANLERLRWAPQGRPNKFVVVNIPSATLWAVNNGSVELEMPVIVGKPVRPTESFVTEIRGVRLNPNWTVPPTIKKHDILPKLREDPEYLINKGIELYDGNGRGAPTLDPTSVDWENVTSRELHSLRMVQMPGAHNPLGEVRILMPNKYNIYLHDTNHREMFASAERALSSGCVRMKEPHKMAEFVLSAEKDWDSARIKSVTDTNKLTDIAIAEPIPVYILYYTAWVDQSGQLVFGPDIYNQDKKLIELLSEIDGFVIPGHTDARLASSGRSEYVVAQ